MSEESARPRNPRGERPPGAGGRHLADRPAPVLRVHRPPPDGQGARPLPGASGAAAIAEVPGESTFQVEIDANSIDTKDETRDAHMRSNDFFGVEDHPTISFRSTASAARRRRERVEGGRRPDHQGHDRPVTVDVEFLGGAIDPWGNQRIGFSGWSPRSTGGSGDWSGTPLGDRRVPAGQQRPPGDRGRSSSARSKQSKLAMVRRSASGTPARRAGRSGPVPEGEAGDGQEPDRLGAGPAHVAEHPHERQAGRVQQSHRGHGRPVAGAGPRAGSPRARSAPLRRPRTASRRRPPGRARSRPTAQPPVVQDPLVQQRPWPVRLELAVGEAVDRLHPLPVAQGAGPGDPLDPQARRDRRDRPAPGGHSSIGGWPSSTQPRGRRSGVGQALHG